MGRKEGGKIERSERGGFRGLAPMRGEVWRGGDGGTGLLGEGIDGFCCYEEGDREVEKLGK